MVKNEVLKVNDSYIVSIENSFPHMKMPLSEDQLAKIEGASKLKLQTKYVAKSERILELERELKTVNSLCSRAANLAKHWDSSDGFFARSDMRRPFLSFSTLYYDLYQEEVKPKAVALIKNATEQLKQYVGRMECSVVALNKTLSGARAELSHALEIEQKGTAGEAAVEAYLSRNLNCRMLSNVVLPSVQVGANTPKTAETDLLVFSQYGIFVCEIKNYGKAGQTLEIQQDGRVLKKDYYGRVLEDMGSPFWQNAHHCNAVSKVLADAGVADIPVYPVVLIANKDVTLANKSRYWVKDQYSFCEAVAAGFGDKTYTSEQIKCAYDAVQAKRMPERKFPIIAVSPIVDVIDEVLSLAEKEVEGKKEWIKQTEKDVRVWNERINEQWQEENSVLVEYNDWQDWIDMAASNSLKVWFCGTFAMACLSHFAWDNGGIGLGFYLLGGFLFLLYWFGRSASRALNREPDFCYENNRAALAVYKVRSFIARLFMSAFPVLVMWVWIYFDWFVWVLYYYFG